jgi:tetratricopeptide (TPR) repeat protein
MKNWLWNKTAEQYYLEGTTQVLKGDYEKAIKLLSKAIEAEPEHLDAHLHRGNIYIDIGDNDHALADLDFVIQKSPDNALAFYNRSIANMGLEKNDQALLDMDRAILLAPDEPGYYNHRCIIHSIREEFDLAIADADKVIELGDIKTGHNNRAVVFDKKGDFPSAIAEWTRVLEDDPNESKAYCNRGILYAKCGDNKKAATDLKQGLKNKKQLANSLRDQSEKTLLKLERAE